MGKNNYITINIPVYGEIEEGKAKFGFELWGFVFMVSEYKPGRWKVSEYSTGGLVPYGGDSLGRYYYTSPTETGAIENTRGFLELMVTEENFRARYDNYINDPEKLGIINTKNFEELNNEKN